MRSRSEGGHDCSGLGESRPNADCRSGSKVAPTSITVTWWAGSWVRARATPAAAGPDPIISADGMADGPSRPSREAGKRSPFRDIGTFSGDLEQLAGNCHLVGPNNVPD